MAVSLVRGVSLSVLIFKRGFFLSLLVSALSGEKNCKLILFYDGLPVVSYHDILTAISVLTFKQLIGLKPTRVYLKSKGTLRTPL